MSGLDTLAEFGRKQKKSRSTKVEGMMAEMQGAEPTFEQRVEQLMPLLPPGSEVLSIEPDSGMSQLRDFGFGF